MKRTFLSIAVLLAAAAGTRPAPLAAQTTPLPTVDQVLEKYLVAIGGRAALEKITSAHLQGTLEIPDFQINGTIDIVQKAPNKVLQTVSLTGTGMQAVQREGFDGTVGWADDPQGGLRERPARSSPTRSAVPCSRVS